MWKSEKNEAKKRGFPKIAPTCVFAIRMYISITKGIKLIKPMLWLHANFKTLSALSCHFIVNKQPIECGLITAAKWEAPDHNEML